MTPDRWRQIEEHYHAALDLPASERAAFLAALPQEIRGEVMELALQGERDSPLDHPSDLMGSSTQLAAGVQIGPYQIEALVGAGGMGKVFRATDIRLGRKVAIKVCSSRFDSRFQREARAIATLNHPNICTLYDVGPDFLVMELVEGPTLAEKMRNKPIPPHEAKEIALQIAEALEAAHEKGVIHRDLKPANIKLTAEGHVKVLDFGLAKATAPSPGVEEATATEGGVIVGTPAYMSPEQAEGLPVDKRTDIWSFGVVVWEMLTGRRLFDAPTVARTMAQVLHQELDFSKVPEGCLRTLLQRCLHRDVKSRLRDIGEARVLLRQPELTGTRRTASPVRCWSTAGIVILSLIVLVAYLWIRRVTSASAEPQPRLLAQIAGPGGRFQRPILSPDGRHLLIVTNKSAGAGTVRLWLRSLDSIQMRLLVDVDRLAVATPAWSPDSEYIAYAVGGRLFRIARSGGAPEQIGEAPIPTPRSFGVAWLQGAVMLSSSTGLYLFRLPGGSATRIDERPSQFVSAFSKDRYIYGRDDGVFLGDLDGGAPIQLTSESTENAIFVPSLHSRLAGHLLFARGRRMMAQAIAGSGRKLSLQGAAAVILENAPWFSASAMGLLAAKSLNETYALSWLDRNGRELQRVSPPFRAPPNPYICLSPNNDARALVPVVAPDGTHDLWMADLLGGVMSRFTFVSGFGAFGIWSPDGRKVLWAAPDGRRFLRSADGSGSDELFFSNPSGHFFVWDWTPDGRLIATGYKGKMAYFDIWLLPADGQRKLYPYTESENSTFWARFSPDSRWMAYASEQSGRPYQIFVESVPRGTGRWQVSGEQGGDWPIWSRDGKELFYAQGQTIMSVPVKLSASTVEFGKPKPLFESKQTRFQVSRDGQRFLVALPTESTEDQMITIDTNWRDRLPRN